MWLWVRTAGSGRGSARVPGAGRGMSCGGAVLGGRRRSAGGLRPPVRQPGGVGVMVGVLMRPAWPFGRLSLVWVRTGRLGGWWRRCRGAGRNVRACRLSGRRIRWARLRADIVGMRIGADRWRSGVGAAEVGAHRCRLERCAARRGCVYRSCVSHGRSRVTRDRCGVCVGCEVRVRVPERVRPVAARVARRLVGGLSGGWIVWAQRMPGICVENQLPVPEDRFARLHEYLFARPRLVPRLFGTEIGRSTEL